MSLKQMISEGRVEIRCFMSTSILYVLWEEMESKCMGTEMNKEDTKLRKVR